MIKKSTNKESKIFSVDHVACTMKNTACQFHQSYEICFFSGGHRTYMIDNSVYEISQNSVIVIPPYTQHSTCGTTAATRTVIYFSKNFLSEYFSPNFIKTLLEEFTTPFCAITQSSDNIAVLVDKLRKNHPQSQLSNTALHLALLLNAIKSAQRLPQKGKENIAQNIVLRAITYIEKNFSNILSLNEIANSLRVSLSYLEANFKKSTGLSLMQYIIKSKINYAAKLLLDTKKSITEISIECGFNSSTHFSNTFKKHMGASPREYRQYR